MLCSLSTSSRMYTHGPGNRLRISDFGLADCGLRENKRMDLELPCKKTRSKVLPWGIHEDVLGIVNQNYRIEVVV